MANPEAPAAGLRPVDERVVERWMSLEIGKVHETLVRAPRPLLDCLLEERPTAATRAGEHVFDVAALRRLAEALSPLTRARVKVPLVVFLDSDMHGECYVADAAAVRAVRELGAAKAEPKGDKVWMSESLARDLALRFPTCVQFVMT